MTNIERLATWIKEEISLSRKRIEELKDDPDAQMGNVIDLVSIKTYEEVLKKIEEIFN